VEAPSLDFRQFFSEDFRTNAPARKLHIDLCADGHLIRRAQYIPFRIRANGVATIEHAQRAAFIELQPQTLQELDFADQEALHPHAQFRRALYKP